MDSLLFEGIVITSFNVTPIFPECDISVVIPARNESFSIETTLKGYYTQNGIYKNPYEINVLINNSQNETKDNTLEIVGEFACSHPDLKINVISIDIKDRWLRVCLLRKIMTDIV